MKFLRLNLLKFGPFSNVTLDLSDRPRALHVIVGSNAVGKSTSLRAITDLLYGIPHKTADAHLHEQTDLRIGGRIASEDGVELDLERRKGRTKTLVDADGGTVDEALVQRLVGGLGREQFEAMFGLSHAGLRAGGEAILEDNGAVGQSLFSAGLGGLGVHHLLQRLEARAEAIWKAGGQNPPLNKAIAQFKEATKSTKDAALPAKAWEALQADLGEQSAVGAKLAEGLLGLRAQERRLERIRDALGPVAQRDEVDRQLSAHQGTVVLPESAPEARRNAQTALVHATSDTARLQAEIADVDGQLAQLEVPTALLARSESMKKLALDLGGHLTAASHLPRRRAELQAYERDVETILLELGSDLPVSEIEILRLKSTVETRLSALAKQRGKLEGAHAGAAEARSGLLRKLEAQGRAQAALPASVDVEPLRRAATLARKDGDLEKRTREQGASRKALEDAFERGHASIGLWTGPMDAIGALAVPSDESIDRFERSATRVEGELSHEARQAEASRKRVASITAELAALSRGQAVPSEDDLARARSERDDTWHSVRRAWLQDGERPAASGGGLTGELLAARFEGEARSADEVADRLRREADRVATHASLAAQRDAEGRELAAIEARCKALEAERVRDDEGWRALWAACGIAPLSPREMAKWLTRYRTLVNDRTRLFEARQQEETLRALIAAHVDSHAGPLAALAEPTPAAGETLAALIARAEDVVAKADALARTRSDAASAIAALEQEVATATTAVETHAAALARWREEWADVTQALGLPASALAEEAEKVVERRKALFAKAKEAADTRHRIVTMEADARAFATLVDDLVATTAPDLAEQRLEQRAEALQERFRVGGERREVRAQLDKRRRDAAADLVVVDQRRVGAVAELARLVAQAHCGDVTELEEAEERSAVVRELRRRANELDAALLGLSGGAGIDALRADCRGRRADEVAATLHALGPQIEESEAATKAPEQEIGKLRERLEAMNGGDRAARAAESAQEALASIRAHVEEYARARLAGVLLREEIERYRSKNQGPIVSRASTLFQALTLRTFSSLEAAYEDDDRAVMRCVRADGRRVGVAGLSDGTLDQLYLALRIASMERHFERAEVVPVIVDDALINFDDERARAALRALGELARTTQVLFFTHHRHLADLAVDAVPANLRVAHELDALVAGAGAVGAPG